MIIGYSRFKEEAKNISEHLPTLKYSENEAGEPIVTGTLILNDEEGKLVDKYNIRIESSEHYPFGFPRVFETNGRLPYNLDWHVFPDGHCCISSMPEEKLICRKGINLKWFIEDQVTPYFFNQVYRELTGHFLRERSHGIIGNLEFFAELLKTNSLLTIAKCFEFIKKREAPTRVSNCFCGSNLKFRKCHKDVYEILNVFSNEELDIYLAWIRAILLKQMEVKRTAA